MFLQDEAVAKLKTETAALGPDWQGYDDGASGPVAAANGASTNGTSTGPASTAAASSAATPMPAAGGTKLKLTFNANAASPPAAPATNGEDVEMSDAE